MSERKIETISVVICTDTGKMDVSIDGNRADLIRAAAMVAKMATQEEGMSEEDNVCLACLSLYIALMEQAETDEAMKAINECLSSTVDAVQKRGLTEKLGD